jgi:hypothetical protein
VTLTYTFKNGGDYTVGVLLIGAESQEPLGAPRVSNASIVSSYGSTAASPNLGPIINTVEGVPQDVYLRFVTNGMGALPEKCVMRFSIEEPGVRPGDIDIRFYDFPSDSYLPLQWSAAGPEAIAATWTPTWLPGGMAISYYTDAFRAILSGESGRHTIHLEIVGATSGKIYGENAIPIDIRRLELALTPATPNDGSGSVQNYALAVRNRSRDAVPEGFTLTTALGIDAGDLSQVKVSYQDPTDGQWKDADLISDGISVKATFAPPGGFQLGALSELAVPIRVEYPLNGAAPTLRIEAFGVDGTWYGSNDGVWPPIEAR